MKKKVLLVIVCTIVCICHEGSNCFSQTTQLQKDTSNIDELRYAVQLLEDGQKFNNIVGSDSALSSVVDAEYEYANVKHEIRRLFNPDKFGIQLPSKVRRKIRDSNWSPRFIEDKLTEIQDTALFLNDQSFRVLLNTIKVKKSDSEIIPVVVLGSPSYESVNLESIIDKNRPEFAYTLDCSGYLNAALTLGVRARKNEINTSAKTAMNKNGAVMVSRASVFSPFVAALRPNSMIRRARQNTFERISTISALLYSLPKDVEDSDEIVIPIEMDLVFCSTSGSAKFNGEASYNVNLGGSAVFASGSFNSNGGASISRTSSFKNYQTFLINPEVLPIHDPITVDEVKNSLESVVSQAVIEKPAMIQKGNVEFTIQYPDHFLDLNWTIKENGYSIISKKLDESGYCTFLISKPADSTEVIITLEANMRGVELEKRVLLPTETSS